MSAAVCCSFLVSQHFLPLSSYSRMCSTWHGRGNECGGNRSTCVARTHRVEDTQASTCPHAPTTHHHGTALRAQQWHAYRITSPL